MNGTQCRMARAALGWSLDDLAKCAGVNKRTIMRHEADEPIKAAGTLRDAFEREGVVFVERGAYVGGVVPPIDGR